MFTAKKVQNSQDQAEWAKHMSARFAETIRDDEKLSTKFSKIKTLFTLEGASQSTLQHRNYMQSCAELMLTDANAQAALQKLGRKNKYTKVEFIQFIDVVLDAMQSKLSAIDTESKSDKTKEFLSPIAKMSTYITQSVQALGEMFGSCSKLGVLLCGLAPVAADGGSPSVVAGDMGLLTCCVIMGCMCFAAGCCHHHHRDDGNVHYSEIPTQHDHRSGHRSLASTIIDEFDTSLEHHGGGHGHHDHIIVVDASRTSLAGVVPPPSYQQF